MTDIVYVLGQGANEIDNRPLRWSLRSLAKHAKNVGRVIVCGYIPEWLSDEVVKIENPDIEPYGKSWQILSNIKTAVEKAGIDKPFLWSSDDHYLCKDVDVDVWPRYWRGVNLPSGEMLRASKKRVGSYACVLAKTRSILERHGLSIRGVPLHLNSWADPRDVNAAWDFAQNFRNLTRDGYEQTCLINAMFEKRMKESGITPEYTIYRQDEKVTAFPDCEQKIKDGLPGFSTTPAAEKDEWLVEWMNSYYSDPSKWEK